VCTNRVLRIATILLHLQTPQANAPAFPINDLIDLGIDLDSAVPSRAQSPEPEPHGALRAQARPLLLYTHGNAEDIGTARGHLQWLTTNLECDVLAYDYVGYGHFLVVFMSEANMYLVVETVYNHAARPQWQLTHGLLAELDREHAPRVQTQPAAR